MIQSILLFSRSTPHHRAGGMETMAWSLAAEWAKVVDDVTIVTTAIAGAEGPFLEEGVKVIPLGDTQPGRYSRAWWDASCRHWESMGAAPDVVLSVSAGAFSVVRDRSRHPRTPFVLQAHGTSAMELKSKLVSGHLRPVLTAPKNAMSLVRDLARYRDFDRVVAVGESVAESLTVSPQSWSVAPNRVHLIPNGVDAERHSFDPRARAAIRTVLDIDDHTTVVGCVGRLHKQKRVDRALKAAAVLRDRGHGEQFRFLVVGDGPEEARLRGLARDLDLKEMVVFVGRVDRDSVRRYNAASDIALLTTAWLEGLPMTVLEALASGLPCVVSTGSVRSEVLKGVIHQVDSADPGQLADALHDVAHARLPRGSILPAELRIDHCANEYLAVFTSLIAGGGS